MSINIILTSRVLTKSCVSSFCILIFTLQNFYIPNFCISNFFPQKFNNNQIRLGSKSLAHQKLGFQIHKGRLEKTSLVISIRGVRTTQSQTFSSTHRCHGFPFLFHSLVHSIRLCAIFAFAFLNTCEDFNTCQILTRKKI